MIPELDRQRFLSKIEVSSDGCWRWLARKDKDGYAIFWYNRKNWVASRFSYLAFVGEIPDGTQIDHECRTRDCVNPEHLRPLTSQQNNDSKPKFMKLFCSRGHRYSPETLFLQKGKNGRINYACRVCQALRGRKYWREKYSPNPETLEPRPYRHKWRKVETKVGLNLGEMSEIRLG